MYRIVFSQSIKEIGLDYTKYSLISRIGINYKCIIQKDEWFLNIIFA